VDSPAAAAVVAVTVLGHDRPGIVAQLTAALADLGGNLEDSTMTLLRGHFAMVVLVRTPATPAAVEAALAPLAADGSLTVDVRPLPEEAGMPSGPGATAGAWRGDEGQGDGAGRPSAWAVRVHGADRPGIVATLTSVLARHGGNIVDLGTRLGGELYVLLVEVELPAGADPEHVRTDLQAAAAALGVTVAFEPVDDELL